MHTFQFLVLFSNLLRAHLGVAPASVSILLFNTYIRGFIVKAFVTTLHVSGNQRARRVLLEVLISSFHPIHRPVAKTAATHRMV
jgi:hypothetical protein